MRKAFSEGEGLLCGICDGLHRQALSLFSKCFSRASGIVLRFLEEAFCGFERKAIYASSGNSKLLVTLVYLELISF